MSPEEELKALEELEELERLETESLASQVDPSLPILGQTLAAQPATNEPGGDEAAEASWFAQGPESLNGKTIVYEPTVSSAQQELLSKPALRAALFEGEEIPDEYIQMMDESSDIYRRYADFKWTEAANAAKAGGRVAYRYSRMPWLHGEAAGLSPLATLASKVQGAALPAFNAISSFIMGADDTANFGAGKIAGDVTASGASPAEEGPSTQPGESEPHYTHPTLGRVPVSMGKPKTELAAPGQSGVETAIEQYPNLHTAGQLGGVFAPLGVAGAMFKGLAAGQKAVASALGGGVAARLGTAVPAAAVGGAAATGVREGIAAAGDLATTGETERTLSGTANQMALSALDPVNLSLGVLGEGAVMGAERAARGIRDMPRYGGNIERVEGLGGRMSFLGGPKGTPAAERAIEVGKKRDILPQDVMAGELAPKIAKVEKEIAAGESAVAKGSLEQAKKAKEQAKVGHAEFKEGFYKSREGQRMIAPQETLGTNLQMLREKHASTPEGLVPVGDAKGVRPARAQFNADIDGVSLEPKPGAIELTPDEAEAFLSSRHASKLMPDSGAPPPSGGGGPSNVPPAGGGGGKNRQGVNVIRPAPGAEAATVPPKGKVAKPAGKVEIPKGSPTADTVRMEAPLGIRREEYGEAMAPHREAQRRDNARAARLARQNPELEPEARDSVASLLTKSMLGAGAGAGLAAATGEDESGAAVAGGMVAIGSGRMVPKGVKRAVDQVSRRTAQAVKRLTAGEREAIRNWSNSSRHTKSAFETVSRTPEENAAKLRKLGYSEEQIQKQNFRRGEKFASEQDEELVKEMTGAMDKLAIDNPTQYGSLHRGFSAGDRMYEMPEIEDLLTKDTFVNKTPISTSYNAQKAEEFAGGAFIRENETPVLLEFKSVRRAAPRVHPDIQSLSEEARMSEAEVLIPPGSTFKVVSRSKRELVAPYDPKVKREATVITLEQVADAPREAWKDAAMIGATLGLGAAAGEEEGGAAAAAAGGLALALKKRGVSKVYVTPRRYNAQQHEVRINQLKTLADNPQMPGAREARELYAAALKDRQQRALGGKPGGWAEVQKVFSDRLSGLDEGISLAAKAAGKKEAAVLKKTPEAAHKRLVRYSQQRPGELPLKQETEALGERAGVSGDLRSLRLLDPLLQLRHDMTVKRANSPGGMPSTGRGIIGATWDPVALRLLYPGLKGLGGTAGSMLGPRAIDLRDARKEE